MIKNILFTALLSFSSGSSLALPNETPFHELNKQNYDDFTTFETASYFNDAFGDLGGYQLGEMADLNLNTFESEYYGQTFIYYALPVHYNIEFSGSAIDLYYSNEYFNFYLNNLDDGSEGYLSFQVLNYTGSESRLPFARLNSSAMVTYIQNDGALTSGIIGTISSWVTGFIGIIVSGLSTFVAVFYNGTNLTTLGTLALLGLGIGLVTLAIAFVTRLFKR